MLALLLVLALHASPSLACELKLPSMELEKCLADDLIAEDLRLTKREKQIRDGLSPRAASEFDDAAARWRAYRDAECRSVHDSKDLGSVAVSSGLTCRIDLAKVRMSSLNKFYRAPP
jgi:uncharacterized protein YecT (DUF1311 family)